MTAPTITSEHLSHPDTLKAFRSIKILIGAYFAVAVIALAVTFFLRDDRADVNSTVWIRSISVVASSALLFFFAVRASHGVRWAYRRLRIVSIVVPIGIVLIIVAPGPYPLWMKIEQGVCGLVVLGLAFVVNGRHLRSLFSKKQPLPLL